MKSRESGLREENRGKGVNRMSDPESSRNRDRRTSDEALDRREVDRTGREEALRAREEAAQARSDLDALMGQLREANEHLVVANLRSQTLAEEAERAYQRVDGILSSITDAFSSFDHEWRCTQINPTAQQFLLTLHKTLDDVVGKNVWDSFPDLAGSIVDEEFHRAAREHVAVTFEAFYPPLQTWFEVNAYPSADGLSVFFRDVTERKQAEVERAKLAAIVESTDDAIISKTPDGIIVSWNKGAERIYGYTAREIVGSHISILVLPEERDELDAMLDRLRAGQSVEHLERVRVRKDGALIDVSLTISPIKDDSGRIIGVSTIARDVTDLKQAEEKAAESTERFRFLAAATPQKIFTARANGEIDYLNPQWAEFTGVSFHRLKTIGWTHFLHQDDMEQSVRQWRHSIDTGEPLQLQHRFRRADGVYRWHLTHARLMGDASGRIARWIATSTDVDDQKRAEEDLARLYAEAERLSRAKDEFLAVISHELRTPMTSILGWSSLLQKNECEPETLALGLKMIVNSARMQEQLVGDMLDVSRVMLGKLRLNPEPFDLAAVVSAAVHALEPSAVAKHIKVAMNVERLGKPVTGDPSRLQQVIWNLLSNAIKFTPEGGNVSVALEHRGTFAEIVISDTGEGIDEASLPHIFDGFWQASRGQHGGLGLGLAIVNRLVELHGGKVSATSTGPGKGSTFSVLLPLQPPANAKS